MYNYGTYTLSPGGYEKFCTCAVHVKSVFSWGIQENAAPAASLTTFGSFFMSITIALLCVILGFVILIYSAQKFVDGASGLALCLGVPEILIGVLIVGFGTSAPEIMVSIFSALEGSSKLALGNSWGSNICNISLILGVTALIAPLWVQRSLFRKEYPLLLLSAAGPLIFAMDGYISKAESAGLLVFISLFVMYTVYEGFRARKLARAGKLAQDSEEADVQIEECSEEARNLGPLKSSLYTFFGLVLMVVSSKVIVFGAVEIAKVLEISEVIIGLTVVAVGTSLPELTASVIAARKGNNELAVGNIIGSNIFNNTAVLGLAGVILPYDVDRIELVRDGGFCLFLTMSLLLFSMRLRTKEARLGRRIGAFWVTTYIAYMALLVYMTMHHNSLPEFLSFISMK